MTFDTLMNLSATDALLGVCFDACEQLEIPSQFAIDAYRILKSVSQVDVEIADALTDALRPLLGSSSYQRLSRTLDAFLALLEGTL